MKSLLTLFSFLLTQSIFSQTGNISSFDFTTEHETIVTVEIDTTKFRPEIWADIALTLYHKETDARIIINDKDINPNDYLSKIEKEIKKGKTTDLGLVNGERSLIRKEIINQNDKEYIVFSYLKIIPPNRSMNFTVLIPEDNFAPYEAEFISSAKSMKFKK